MAPSPEVVADADGVNGDCVVKTAVVGDHDTAWVPTPMVKLIDAESAERYGPDCAIDALIEHVPAETKVTTPDTEPTVHTGAVLVMNDLTPEPADAVAVIVGGVAVITYVAEYDETSIASVLDARGTYSDEALEFAPEPTEFRAFTLK